MAGQRRSVTCVMSNLTLPSRPSADASVVRGGGGWFLCGWGEWIEGVELVWVAWTWDGCGGC